jgi:hypothetical protein
LFKCAESRLDLEKCGLERFDPLFVGLEVGHEVVVEALHHTVQELRVRDDAEVLAGMMISFASVYVDKSEALGNRVMSLQLLLSFCRAGFLEAVMG